MEAVASTILQFINVSNQHFYHLKHTQSLCVSYISIIKLGASLVAQWLRIRLPMQGTQAGALVQEDPTCRGATKPVHHNY